jgi:hypothetical protein
MKFEDYEYILCESLTNPDKIALLPIKMQCKQYDMNPYSNIRILIKHFSYFLQQEELKNKSKKDVIKKAQDLVDNFFDKVKVEKVSKEVYLENKTD